MDDMKSQIELKLIATQLSDWCRHKEGFIFKSSLCTQEFVQTVNYYFQLMNRIIY